MKRAMAVGLMAALLAGLSGAAGANQGKDNKTDDALSLLFKQIDTNGDGKVTKAKVLAFFAKIDKDGKGFVTLAEFKAVTAGLASSAEEKKKDKK